MYFPCDHEAAAERREKEAWQSLDRQREVPAVTDLVLFGLIGARYSSQTIHGPGHGFDEVLSSSLTHVFLKFPGLHFCPFCAIPVCSYDVAESLVLSNYRSDNANYKQNARIILVPKSWRISCRLTVAKSCCWQAMQALGPTCGISWWWDFLTGIYET